MQTITSFQTAIGNVEVHDDYVLVTITAENQTMEILKAHYSVYEAELGTEKRKVILDFAINNIRLEREERAFSIQKLNSLTSDIAGIIHSPLVRIFVNIFMKINTFEYNYKVCKSVDEAKAWVTSL